VAGFLAALAPFAAVLGTPAALVANAVPAQHAAHPTALTLHATFELQCGRATGVSVGLPATMHWRSIGPAAVTVNGSHPAFVRTSQHVVQVTMPPPHGAICDSIGPARVTVRFSDAAGLVNPPQAGSYAIWLRARGQTATGRLRIS
jgi:hypothetical protein